MKLIQSIYAIDFDLVAEKLTDVSIFANYFYGFLRFSIYSENLDVAQITEFEYFLTTLDVYQLFFKVSGVIQFYGDANWAEISAIFTNGVELTAESWAEVTTALNRVDLVIDFNQLKIDVDQNFELNSAQVQIQKFFSINFAAENSVEFTAVFQKFVLSLVRFDSASGSVQSQLRSFFLQFEEKYVTNAVSEESRNIAISVLSQITDLSYSEEFSSLLFLLEVNLIFENAFTLDFGYIQYNAISFDQITENFDLKFANFDFAFFTTIMESLSLSGKVKIKIQFLGCVTKFRP